MLGAHGRKLDALFQNKKLPKCDKKRKAEVMAKYKEWRETLDDDSLSAEEYIKAVVDKTNEYKNFIDIDFIFMSQDNFLYRQAGQLKINNSILEECMSCLFDKRLIPGAFTKPNSFGGDVSCYAGFSFGTWNATAFEDRFFIKTKDQDFSIGKVINLTIADGGSTDRVDLNVAYFATEIKTVDQQIVPGKSRMLNRLQMAG